MKIAAIIVTFFSFGLATQLASADHWNGYERVQMRLAEKEQYRDTYLPRRYQTSNVIDAAEGFRKGAAWLIRSRNGIDGRIMSNVPTAGDPYTLWVVVFNNPAACDGPCDDPDIVNPDVRASIFNATGAISADNGKGGGVLNLDFNIVAGNLPNDLFVLIGEGGGLGRNNGFDAQLLLVIDRHPPIETGAAEWITDLTMTNFPGGPATNNAVAVFVPCPEASCPASVL